MWNESPVRLPAAGSESIGCALRASLSVPQNVAYGRASATYSLGMSSQPTATTMYCLPSTR